MQSIKEEVNDSNLFIKNEYDRKTYFDIETNRCHRIGAPAILWNDGSETWFYYGKEHRVGGPSFTERGRHHSVINRWCRLDKRHRLNAPAEIRRNGDRYYYEFGNPI